MNANDKPYLQTPRSGGNVRLISRPQLRGILTAHYHDPDEQIDRIDRGETVYTEYDSFLIAHRRE